MEDKFNFDEQPKHKKKKLSNTSKASRRADHKHINTDALLYSTDDKHWHRGIICEVCGKIQHICYFETEQVQLPHFRGLSRVMLDQSKILEKYSNLDRYTYSGWKARYIDGCDPDETK